MSDDSRRVDRGVIAVAGCLIVVLLGAGGFGGYWLYNRFKTDEPVAQRDAVNPVEVDVDQPEEPPADPLADMRPRYRPGPFVQTVGLLPSGLSSLRRLAANNRGGHTMENPWVVAGAELRPGAPPTGAPGPILDLPDQEQDLSVIPGTPTTLPLRARAGFGDDATIQGLLIVFQGYEGYFFLPAGAETELGHIQVAGEELGDMQFGIDVPTLPGGALAPSDREMKANVRVAAVDMGGRISPWQTRHLTVMPLGTGDVEVALTMSEATDLDLYVVDPAGQVIYYGNRRAGNQGQLDLDANSACNGNMGVNAEHVFWPTGMAPAGTYQVRVSNYSSCINGRPVDYRISVRNCGESAVFSGQFVGEGDSRNCTTDPGSDRSWCQQVLSFDVTPCNQRTP